MYKENLLTDFGKKLKKARVKRGLTQQELANLIETSKSVISGYENGKNDPARSVLLKLSKSLGVSLNYLMGWEDENEKPILENIPGIIPIKKLKKIPILGTIACGEPIFAEENYEGYFMLDTNLPVADFVLKAKGDSMVEANIFDGDLVFFKKQSDVDNGDIAAVIIDDEATLKKIYKNESNLILQPCNSNYVPIVLSEDDHKNIRILGEMVGVYSKRNK